MEDGVVKAVWCGIIKRWGFEERDPKTFPRCALEKRRVFVRVSAFVFQHSIFSIVSEFAEFVLKNFLKRSERSIFRCFERSGENLFKENEPFEERGFQCFDQHGFYMSKGIFPRGSAWPVSFSNK